MRISDWSSDVCSSDLIARPVGEEHAVRLVGEDGLGGGICGHYGDVAAQARQAAQDVELGAVVDGNHLVAWRRLVAVALAERPARLVPAIGDRKSVVEGKSVSVRVDLGGRLIIKKKNN